MGRKNKVKIGIRVKTILMIVGFALVVVETAMIYFSVSTSRINEQTYETTATSLSNTVSEVINIADAKYSYTITPYKIEHIIYQLPIGLLSDYKENNINSDDYEKDEIEEDYDTNVF